MLPRSLQTELDVRKVNTSLPQTLKARLVAYCPGDIRSHTISLHKRQAEPKYSNAQKLDSRFTSSLPVERMMKYKWQAFATTLCWAFSPDKLKRVCCFERNSFDCRHL